MKVDNLSFEKTVFAGPVSMADARFRNLRIESAQDATPSWPSLNLSQTVVTSDLHLTHLTLQELLAPSLRVEGRAFLSEITVDHTINLQDSSFAILIFANPVSGIINATTVLLDGMTYQQLRVGSRGEKTLRTEETREALLALAQKDKYHAEVYVILETFFRQHGYAEQADAVFIARKRRERSDVLGGLSHVAWWKNLVLDGVAGHGRHPEWAVLWSALVVGLGYGIFYSRNSMDPRKDEDAARPYNAFWYSLDLFAPIINLEAANVWRPKDDCRWRVYYMRVQKILGWLLVPLGVAAWTGILK
jgi:hypothetical protein